MIPVPLQTAYMELLQRLEARPEVTIDGSLMRIEKSGRGYWVARRRVGDRVIEEAIGPDTAEIRERVRRAKAEQAARQDWARGNAALVSMLRAAGCIAPDPATGRVMAALERIGWFRAGGILGGTNAFRLYPLFLGISAPQRDMAHTSDVDMIAHARLSLAGPAASIRDRLASVGLATEVLFGLTPGAPKKLLAPGGVEIEILAPVSRSGRVHPLHRGLGERVSALKFIEFIMVGPIRQAALHRSGVEILAPSPERYALHKLIVAQLRSGAFSLKKNKDLAQAGWLLPHLAEIRPFETWQAWADLVGRGKTWLRHARASLERIPAARDAIERLEEEYGAPTPGADDR